MKYGNNPDENAYDHAHALNIKQCAVCGREARNGHHFSITSSDNCYFLCDRHEKTAVFDDA